MNYELARKLIIEHSSKSDHPDTLLNRLQQGKPPIPGQITSILVSLKIIFETLKTETNIDKELANSLYQLAMKPQKLFIIGRKAGVDWPPLLNEDLLRISYAVESIFSGIWET